MILTTTSVGYYCGCRDRRLCERFKVHVLCAVWATNVLCDHIVLLLTACTYAYEYGEAIIAQPSMGTILILSCEMGQLHGL